MTSGSLRLRLVAGGAAAITLALAVAGWGLTQLFERHVLRSLAADLEVVLKQAVGAIELTPDGHPVLKREPADPRFAMPMSGLYWQAVADNGLSISSRSLWDARLPLPEDTLAPGETHEHRIAGPGGSELLALERTVLIEARGKPQAIRISVAADLSRLAEARRAFTADLVLALSLLGLTLGAATWVQIGLGLRPLQRVREAVASVRAGESAAIREPVPDEVAPLAEEINALLASQAREMERTAGQAANLAHGLKTPLAALAADARRLREKGEIEIALGLEEAGETMRRHVEREMARARIRGSRPAAPPPRTVVAPLLESIIALQKRGSEDADLVFETALPAGFEIGIDRADLAEVLGNLLENAARHARHRVRISGAAGPEAGLVIEDDGAGVPAQLRDKILERGTRLDEKGPGAGLGLAIVQDVLDAYGRSLTLETSDLGGLKIMF